MIRGRDDLPLRRDTSIRILPWLLGILVYLATLSAAAAAVLSNIAAHWSGGLGSEVTIQVPPDVPSQAASGDEVLEALRRAIAQVEGVAAVEIIGPERAHELVEPWLGSELAMEELPLPSLMAVTLEEAAVAATLPRIEARLEELAPEASIDDHSRWLAPLVDLARWLQRLALLAVLLVGATVVVAVVLVTRLGLAVHHDIVDLLHIIGARDNYIARQFERQAARLSVVGSVAGVVTAALTLATLSWLAAGSEGTLVPRSGLEPLQWLALPLIPVAVVGIALITTRLTVRSTLHRMP